ncbi:MAG: MBL fold metallo-hydrolase [Opitutaceae bacterium]|nr:MBL fold metallo-hydrolase [Opitutaceae bacterium]
MNITWLGQSGFLVEVADQRLLIDPYFSDIVERKEGLRRLVPPPCRVEALAPHALFITHDHLDHYDPETVAAVMNTASGCRLIGPASVTAHAVRDGIPKERLTCIAPGGTFAIGPFRITGTQARHSDALAIGLLLRTPSECLWFSGDTLYFPELAACVRELAGGPPDIAFVCINGRLGNMNLHEAARVVAELRPRLAVPMHYGMFAENTADPAEFRSDCDGCGVRTALLTVGHCMRTARLLDTHLHCVPSPFSSS